MERIIFILQSRHVLRGLNFAPISLSLFSLSAHIVFKLRISDFRIQIQNFRFRFFEEELRQDAGDGAVGDLRHGHRRR